MDLGINNGLFTNTPNGVHNGIYTGTNNGVFNGVYNENFIRNGVIRDGLILYVDASNPISSPYQDTIWKDLSPSAINGTLTNGPVYNSINKGYISFDGTNDFVTFGNNFNFENNTPFSLCGWFYFNNDNDFVLIAKEEETTFRGWVLRKLANYQLMFALANNVNLNQLQIRTSTFSVTNNVWYHIATTYDGSRLAAGANIYINGRLMPKTVILDAIGTNTIITSAVAAIGKIGITTNQLFFNGRNALSQIYNRGLSQGEVIQNFLATKARFNL